VGFVNDFEVPCVIPFAADRAPRGMVTTVDGLASGAGVAMLRSGGTAADAAVAAAAVLAVTTQHICGMGGDLFAVIHTGDGPPVALNASGRAGSGADPSQLRAEGATRMPFRGDIRSVTIPGCVDGWCALHERYGRLPLAELLAPAIAYAREGFPASPLLERSATLIAGLPGADDYPPGLAAGDRLTRPGLASALEAIGREGRSAWYEGRFGAGLVALGRGEFSAEDLATVQADWVEPIVVGAWEHEIWTVPPNSQGYVTLAAARIASEHALPDPDDSRWAHVLIEAIKAAAHDRLAVLHEHCDPSPLLARAAVVGEMASAWEPPVASGGTIHLNAVAYGMAVSLTQSNCAGFGAHIAVPEVRVFLQNRGSGFSLDPGHPAEYGPGKRPPHTLCPTMVTRDATARFALGTMGADNQPMTLLQLLARLLAGGSDPADALAAGRFMLAAPSAESFAVWSDPSKVRVLVEAQAPAGWVEGLRARGHDAESIDAFSGATGHAHIIEVGDDMLLGAADPRSLIGRAVGY
jgi:gamma-glutamyltranspeptidase/glutathione hydrolase